MTRLPAVALVAVEVDRPEGPARVVRISVDGNETDFLTDDAAGAFLEDIGYSPVLSREMVRAALRAAPWSSQPGEGDGPAQHEGT